jgi:hypothetical protein
MPSFTILGNDEEGQKEMHGIILEMIVFLLHLGPYNIFTIAIYLCLSRFNSLLDYQVVCPPPPPTVRPLIPAFFSAQGALQLSISKSAS